MKGTKHVRNAPLSRRDQLKLKAYDSLNLWNDNESKVNLRLDALAISVIGIIAYAVSKQNYKSSKVYCWLSSLC